LEGASFPISEPLWDNDQAWISPHTTEEAFHCFPSSQLKSERIWALQLKEIWWMISNFSDWIQQLTFCFRTHRNNSRAGRKVTDILRKDVRAIFLPPKRHRILLLICLNTNFSREGAHVSLSLMNINALLSILVVDTTMGLQLLPSIWKRQMRIKRKKCWLTLR